MQNNFPNMLGPGIFTPENQAESRPKPLRDIIATSTNQKEIADQVNRLHSAELKPDLINLPVLDLDDPFADKEAFAHSVFLAMQSNRLVESIAYMSGKYPTRSVRSNVAGSADKMTRLKVAQSVAETFLADPRAIGFTLEVDRKQNSYIFYLLYSTNPNDTRESLRLTGVKQRELARIEIANNPEFNNPARARFEMDKLLENMEWAPYYMAFRRPT